MCICVQHYVAVFIAVGLIFVTQAADLESSSKILRINVAVKSSPDPPDSSTATGHDGPPPVNSDSNPGDSTVTNIQEAAADVQEKPKITDLIKPIAKTAIQEESSNENSPRPSQGNVDAVPKIDGAVKEMIKPLAGSAATPTPEASPGEAVKGSDEAAKPPDEAKKGIPKFDVSVTKPLTETSGPSPLVEPAPEATSAVETAAEGASGKISTNEESKLEGPPASSGITEETVLQTPGPSPAEHSSSAEGGKESATTGADTEPATDQIRATITPLNSATPGEESSTSSSVKPNAYTITPGEFAKKTAVAHAQKSEEESKEAAAKDPDPNPDKFTVHQETDVDNGANSDTSTESSATTTQNPEHSSAKDTSTATKEGEIGSEKEGEEDSKKISEKANAKEDKPLKSSQKLGNINIKGVVEIANNIKNNFQAISENYEKKWNEEKTRTSWLDEIAGLLKTYSEKINESKDIKQVFNKCPGNVEQIYQDKKNQLDRVINDCESHLNRTYRENLQNQVNEKIKKVEELLKEYNEEVGKIKDDPHFNAKKLVIDDGFKQKLLYLENDSVKNELQNLAEQAFTQDKRNYEECVDRKNNKDLGSKLKSEIYSLINREYSCV